MLKPSGGAWPGLELPTSVAEAGCGRAVHRFKSGPYEASRMLPSGRWKEPPGLAVAQAHSNIGGWKETSWRISHHSLYSENVIAISHGFFMGYKNKLF